MKITRSFSRKIQVQPYEPAEFFCGAEMEAPDAKAITASHLLDEFCQREVAASIAKLYPSKKLNHTDRGKSQDQAQDSTERDTEQEIPDAPTEIIKE